MSILSRSLKIFLIFLGLLLIAVLAFVATFDAENYRPQIIAQVEKITGRDFSIDGEINLSVFPWVGLKVEDVSLGNANGFSAEQFAVIKQLDVKLNVLPLLKKEVQVNTIRLHGLNVSLEVASDKSNNWSGLIRSQETSQEEQAPADEASTGVPALTALLVEGFEILDARIQYDDRSTNTSATVSDVNLTTGEIRFAQPVNIEFSAHLENRRPKLDAQLKLATQLVINRNFNEFDLHDLVLTLFVKANDFLPQDEQLELKSTIHASLEQQHVTIEPLKITALNTTTQAAIDVSQLLQNPVVQGDIEVLPFNARVVARSAGVTLPEMANSDALQHVALKTDINFQGEKVEANNITLSLDKSILSGWLHVVSLSQQQLRYDLTLDQIIIDDYLPVTETDNASPAVSAVGSASATSNTADTTGDEKIELPLELMRQLDVQGDFRISSLTALQYNITQFVMGASAHKGIIRVEPLSMQLLDGQMSSAVNIDVVKDIPVYAMNMDARQLQAGPVANPLLAGLMGDKPLTMNGAVNLLMNVNSRGETVNTLKKAASGKIDLDMNTTEVNGFDPEYYMRSSIANYLDSKGLGLSKSIMGNYEPREVTVFDKIHSTIKLADGRASTNDFLMDSLRVQVKGNGYADIVDNSLDVTSSVRLPRNQTVLEKVLDEPMYVRIHGPFEALQYDIDMDRLKKSTSDVLEQEAKAKAQEKLEEEKLRLKLKAEEEKRKAEEKARQELQKKSDDLQQQLKDKLKGLF